ncbi:MAG TPA: HEAT repeat domain-containing protein [Vicinamibacterales bacterium]|nr:HEAT repeat domain-containing protein [Vicinamibacterales bacterium]
MNIRQIVTTSAVLLAFAAPAFAQDPNQDTERIQAQAEKAQAAAERAQAQAEARAERARAQGEARAAARGAGIGVGRGAGFNGFVPGPIDVEAVYDAARQAIENNQFQIAIRDLDRVLAGVEKQRGDAAMYWKAYSQSKLDLDKEALETIKQLSKDFAKSPWVKDANALAVEIQSANGQPISAELQNDEELKLLALRSVMQADPDKGVPIIEKMLAGGASPRVRDRALFVLSQSRSPRARDVMVNTAKNNGNPDLQRSAIRYLGMMGGAGDRETLTGIYRTATDASVKRAILQSYMMSGNVDGTVDAAKNEKDGDLRRLAIHNLGVMRNTSGANTGDALVSIYKSDSQSDIKRAVVNSLFMQRNAKALVELAKAEKDASMKREIVQKLSIMKEPEATDYMLELLK